MRGQQSPSGTSAGTSEGTTTSAANGTEVATGEQFANRFEDLLDIPGWLADLTLTLLVVVLSWYGARLLTRTFGRRIARRFRRPSVTRTVLRLMRGAVYALGFLTIVGIYGVSLGDITLSVTVFSAVIGIVLAPIVGSYIQGFFVLADQPYEVGDMIELVGQDPPQRGFVEDITLRYTKIFTLNNTFLVVPNGTMRERDVINYSAEDSRARLTLDVLVTYEGDLAAARELVEEAARGVDRVVGGGPDIRIGSARYPAAPTCYIENFADHGVNLRLRYWVREPYKLLTVRSNVQERIWDRLDDAAVEIAYPHSHLHFDDTSGELPVAVRDGESRATDPRGDGAPRRTDSDGVPPRRSGDDTGEE
jgi:small-conductance mechanosensitive channel